MNISDALSGFLTSFVNSSHQRALTISGIGLSILAWKYSFPQGSDGIAVYFRLFAALPLALATVTSPMEEGNNQSNETNGFILSTIYALFIVICAVALLDSGRLTK
jgi:hypothetical protein